MHNMVDQYDELIEALNKCRRVLITTHVRPDGDALGTAAAMVLGMRRKNIQAEVLLLSHLPTKYAFVFQDNAIPYHNAETNWPDDLNLDHFDALLVVDTGTWSQLPGLRQRLVDWSAPKYVLDHHLTQEDWATLKVVDTQAAGAGEMACQLLQRWAGNFDQPIAAALFLAIVSDTGWFQFANTRPRTLRIAADLMETGIDTDSLYQRLYHNENDRRFILHNRAGQSLQLLAGGRLAIMRLNRQDFSLAKAAIPDTENLVNDPLVIGSVQVSVLLVESPDNGEIRVSLRSKGTVDVARFAESFGGGGHARAAGLRINAPLDEAVEKVGSALVHLLEQN